MHCAYFLLPALLSEPNVKPSPASYPAEVLWPAPGEHPTGPPLRGTRTANIPGLEDVLATNMQFLWSPFLCLWSPLSFKGSVSFCRGHRTTDRRAGKSLRDGPVQLHCFRMKTQGMMGLGQHNKWKYQCLRSCASGSSGLVTTSTKFGHYWKHVSKCRNAANGGDVAHRMISVLHKDPAFLRQSRPPHRIPTGRGGFSREV